VDPKKELGKASKVSTWVLRADFLGAIHLKGVGQEKGGSNLSYSHLTEELI